MKVKAGHGFTCGMYDTNYESGGDLKSVRCAMGVNAVHMRAAGEPNGGMTGAEGKVIYRVRGASLFRPRIEHRL